MKSRQISFGIQAGLTSGPVPDKLCVSIVSKRNLQACILVSKADTFYADAEK